MTAAIYRKLTSASARHGDEANIQPQNIPHYDMNTKENDDGREEAVETVKGSPEEAANEPIVGPKALWERRKQEEEAMRAQSCGFKPSRDSVKLVPVDALGPGYKGPFQYPKFNAMQSAVLPGVSPYKDLLM